MKLHNTALVIGHEYSARVRKKSFILTTILTPLLMGLLMVIPAVIMYFGGGEQAVKVFDGTGVILPELESDGEIRFLTPAEGETPEILTSIFEETGLYAVAVISDFDEKGDVSVRTYSGEPLNYKVRDRLEKSISETVERRKLESYGIEGIGKILEDVKTDISVEALTIKENGDAREENVEVYMAISYMMAFLIYLFVILFGNMVMRSVIDEKSSRIVEVIVSSVDCMELMAGKIIGVALVALTQFAVWVVLLAVFAGVAGSLILPPIPAAGPSAELTPDISGMAIGNVFAALSGIDWLYMLGNFVIYFLLGYLLYASMFAAIGSAVDNEADTNQLSIPVTIPLIIGLFIMIHTFEHPSSQLSFWASIIPWTSPMVMLARLPFGVVKGWELILSIGLLLATFAGTAWASAKIYRAGILMYGKKSSWKDLIRWINQKQ